MSQRMEHICSQCSHRYELPALPSFSARLSGAAAAHVPFSAYVYAVCPKCGRKDWADERKFFFALGARAFYAIAFALTVAFVILVVYLGFYFKV